MYTCMFLNSLSYWLFEVHVMFPKQESDFKYYTGRRWISI